MVSGTRVAHKAGVMNHANHHAVNRCHQIVRIGVFMQVTCVNRLRHKHDDGEIMITGEDVQKLTDILAHRQPEDAQ